MDQSLKERTLENLTKAQSIVVIVNEDSSIDGLASGLAIYLSLVKLGKNVSILAKTPSVGDAQKLYGVDKIGTYKGSKNLIVVINNAIETIDRVSHFLDGDKLKLILHVFPQSNGISQNQISFEEEGVKPDVVFAVGYNSEDELKKEIEHVQNIDSKTWLVNISRKDLGQIFAQVNMFDEKAASLSEITGSFINQLALPVDEDIAYNLYAGISEATLMFSPARTGPLSLEIASWLLKFGAGRAGFAQMGDSRSLPTSFAESAQANFAQAQTLSQQPPQHPTPEQVVMPKVPPIQPSQPQAAPTNQTSEPAPAPQEPKISTSSKSWLNPPKIYKGSETF